MGLSKKPYKGCRDLYPVDKREQDFIFDTMRTLAQSYGYEPYDGPMLEPVELYKAKSGQELIDDQIYSFKDRGERDVAIRPEMTPTVARMVAGIHREVPKPIRWYSIPNLMRYERPQKGRLREHWQFNVDIFGPDNVYNEIEILQLGIHLFEKFGADEKQFGIEINNRLFVDFFLKETLGLDSKKVFNLYKLIDRSKKLKPSVFEEKLHSLNLNSSSINLLKKYLLIDSIEKFEHFAKEINFRHSLWDYKTFFETLKELNILKYIQFNSSIVRGLDYYTGLVFEIFDKNPENKRALCGGGAYAGLMNIFDEDKLPGVGFGLGDVTLKDFLHTHTLMPNLSAPRPDIFIASEDDQLEIETIKISSSLRGIGLSVLNNTMKLKFNKILQIAQKSDAATVGIIQRDKENIQIKIKNFKNKETETFCITDLQGLKGFICHR